jgi:hypothetical protein
MDYIRKNNIDCQLVDNDIIYKYDNLYMKKLEFERYELIFESKKSFHYCTNGCNDSNIVQKCKCTDKDWWNDIWQGRLIINDDLNYLADIFHFLIGYYQTLLKFDRAELWNWFGKNKEIFLKKYYFDLYTELENFMFSISHIFTDEFYEEFKKNINDKYKNILKTNNYDNSNEIEIQDKLLFIPVKSYFNRYHNLFGKIEVYNNYQKLNESELFNENLNEKFSKILKYNEIYESIVLNLEATLIK